MQVSLQVKGSTHEAQFSVGWPGPRGGQVSGTTQHVPIACGWHRCPGLTRCKRAHEARAAGQSLLGSEHGIAVPKHTLSVDDTASTPARCRRQSFQYVTPSQPHLGAYVVSSALSQVVGASLHWPVVIGLQSVFEQK